MYFGVQIQAVLIRSCCLEYIWGLEL